MGGSSTDRDNLNTSPPPVAAVLSAPAARSPSWRASAVAQGANTSCKGAGVWPQSPASHSLALPALRNVHEAKSVPAKAHHWPFVWFKKGQSFQHYCPFLSRMSGRTSVTMQWQGADFTCLSLSIKSNDNGYVQIVFSWFKSFIL